MENATRRKVDVIYNTTLVCPWDCAVCCVDAVHVKKDGASIRIKSDGLTSLATLPFDAAAGSIYDQASRHRQKMGKELDLAGKLRIIDHLAGFDAKIDISGGDALSVTENFRLLEYASNRLGRLNVTLTVTGAGSARFPARVLAPLIGEYNFTFDAESLSDVALRPEGYALGNLKKAIAFVREGVATRAEAPLSKAILGDDHLTRLYQTLHSAGIAKLLVMRLFPVGRGALLEEEIPSAEEYRHAIGVLREFLSSADGTPKVKVQCALKHLVGAVASSGGNPCDLVNEFLRADGRRYAARLARYRSQGQAAQRGVDPWQLGGYAARAIARDTQGATVRTPQRRKFRPLQDFLVPPLEPARPLRPDLRHRRSALRSIETASRGSRAGTGHGLTCRTPGWPASWL